jgi:hypothetical protein
MKGIVNIYHTPRKTLFPGRTYLNFIGVRRRRILMMADQSSSAGIVLYRSIRDSGTASLRVIAESHGMKFS